MYVLFKNIVGRQPITANKKSHAIQSYCNCIHLLKLPPIVYPYLPAKAAAQFNSISCRITWFFSPTNNDTLKSHLVCSLGSNSFFQYMLFTYHLVKSREIANMALLAFSIKHSTMCSDRSWCHLHCSSVCSLLQWMTMDCCASFVSFD